MAKHRNKRRNYVGKRCRVHAIQIYQSQFTMSRRSLDNCSILSYTHTHTHTKAHWCTSTLYLSPKSHNTPVPYSTTHHVATILLQSFALWDICLMHCGLCEMDLSMHWGLTIMPDIFQTTFLNAFLFQIHGYYGILLEIHHHLFIKWLSLEQSLSHMLKQ